jgi:S-adenosylmethionine-dependent methyltransferase
MAMAANAGTFDAGMAAWQAWQRAPWGRLYYDVAHANLARHLGAAPLAILDAGGGNGADALRLAGQGHDVTLLDSSTEMLADARRAAEAQGLAGRLTVRQGDCLAIPDLFPGQPFDVVLCHNVLQYAADAGAPLRRGGLLSLLAPNRHAEPLRAALREGDLAAAYALLDAPTRQTHVFKATMRLYTASEVVALLNAPNYAVIGQYGVRCLCDYLPDDGRKNDPAYYAELERLENALAATYPYDLVARYFHLMVRKEQSA